jgi:ribonuclease-3
MKTRSDDLAKDGKVVFECRLGHAFRDAAILDEALTHASYANELGIPRYNERLEFLGDAVLELCVSEILFSARPDFDEGRLTKERSLVVREATLAKWAKALGIPDLLRLGRGLEMQNGRKNASVLADAAEAVIGAVFLDGGYDAAKKVVERRMKDEPTENAEDAAAPNKDAKSLLQERLQAAGGKPPSYILKKRTGPDHASTFEVELCLSDGRTFASGRGNSIKSAEFAAAQNALARLEQGPRSEDNVTKNLKTER